MAKDQAELDQALLDAAVNENDSVEEAKKAVEDGANVSHLSGERRQTPLFAAANHRNWKIVEMLLQCDKTNIALQDRHGYTILHYLCVRFEERNIQEMVNIQPLIRLIINKKDPTILNITTKGTSLTALHFICNGSIKNHTNDEKIDDGKNKILAQRNKILIDTMQLLLDAGANVNAVNDMNETPFLMACRRGNVALVRCLVEKNHADFTVSSSTQPLRELAPAGNALFYIKERIYYDRQYQENYDRCIEIKEIVDYLESLGINFHAVNQRGVRIHDYLDKELHETSSSNMFDIEKIKNMFPKFFIEYYLEETKLIKQVILDVTTFIPEIADIIIDFDSSFIRVASKKKPSTVVAAAQLDKLDLTKDNNK